MVSDLAPLSLDSVSSPTLIFAAILISAGLSFLLSRFVWKFCGRFRILDYPTKRKQHLYPMPHLGGVSLFVSFWVVFLIIYFNFESVRTELLGQIGMVFLASFVVFLTGLLDDLYNLTYLHKIIGQLVAASIIIAAGFVIPRFHIPFLRSVELGWLSFPITAVWIVVLSNSINLIDGTDGLAASVSIVVCAGMLVTGLLLHVQVVVALSVVLAGTLAGFLVLNWPPARLFMGDSGSLFLGFMFSILAVICPIKSYTAVAMFVPLVAVGVPLTEVAVTFIRRTAAGQRFYRPDNKHIYHYLLRFGFSPSATVLWLSAVSLAFTAFIPALFWFDRRKVFSIFLLFLAILFVIFFVLRLKQEDRRPNGRRNST